MRLIGRTAAASLRNRISGPRGAVVGALTVVLVAGCGDRRETERPGQPGPASSPSPIEHRVGWLHSACLAIDNKTLAAGSPVAIVTLGDAPSVIDGSIAGTATSGDKCPALMEDRRATNVAKGLAFYEVRTPQGVSVDLAIGIVGDTTRVGSGIDISGDGIADHFTECATSEGVSFAVWSGTPYQGAALWSAYYYLGYDTESTCPAK